MLHDSRSVPLSPSKGKAREETRWRTGWWDFAPLVEQPQKSLVWSEASIIFFAHPTRPEVIGRHFASSKQFLVPPPGPVSSSPTLFNPPTFISVSPGDKHIFAFYPGKAGDGLGCIWKRGPRLDSWNVIDSWKFTGATYPVAAEWLGGPRTWHIDASRHPFRGPRTPVSSPTFLYITADHRANLCYLRYYTPSLKVVSCSLDESGIVSDVTLPNNVHGSKQCIAAGIGLAYEDSSILIATRLRCLPSQFTDDPEMNMNSPGSGVKIPDCEMWGEEGMIHLCELRLEFDSMSMSMYKNPLQPIQQSPHSLTKLYLEPSIQYVSDTNTRNGKHKTIFYVISAYLDFGDYTSTPKSEIIVNSLSRSDSNKDTDTMTWNIHEEARRSFHPEVLCFLAPFVEESNLLHVGTMKTSGSIPKKNKSKNVDVGSMKVLRLPDLKDDDKWQPSTISSTMDKLGRELPLITAVSPNGILISTMSLLFPHVSVHSLPGRKSDSPIPHTAIALLLAVRLGKSTSDITHVLSSPSISMNEIVNTLHRTAQLLDKQENGVSYLQTGNFMGIIIEVYRSRVKHHISEDEKESLELRSRILLDILTLKTFNEAFDDCRDESGHADLHSIWQLIGLSEFIVHFMENLIRECIFRCNLVTKESPQVLDSPLLLPLVHPYAFENICKAVRYVAKFREYVGSLPAGGEKEGTAKSVLLDFVDCSGIDFTALERLLSDCTMQLKHLNADDCRLSLVLCQPVPSMYSALINIIKRIDDSKALDKSKLFIKPADLVDGVQQLSIGREKKESDIDVVFRKPLGKQTPEFVCLRCGGASMLGSDLFKMDVSIKWRMWEKMQLSRCICYGFCIRGQ